MSYLIKRMEAFDNDYRKLMFKRQKILGEVIKKRAKIEARIKEIDKEVARYFNEYMQKRESELYCAHNDFLVLSNLQTNEITTENRDAYFMASSMDLRSYIVFRLRIMEKPDGIIKFEDELSTLVKLWNGGIGSRCDHCGNVVEYGTFHEHEKVATIDYAMFYQTEKACAIRIAYDGFASAFCFKYDLVV